MNILRNGVIASAAIGGGGSSALFTNWTNVTNPFSYDYQLNKIDNNGDFLIVVGSDNQMGKSTDDGLTWSSISSGINADIYDVCFDKGQDAWAEFFAAIGGTAGSLCLGDSRDVGIVHSCGSKVNGIVLADGNSIMVGDGGFIDSLNFDSSNFDVDAPAGSAGINLYCIESLGGGSFILGGAGGHIYKSTDYGGSWSAKASDTTEAIHAIACNLDESVLIAVGECTTVQYSNDFGHTWTSGEIEDLYGEDITFYDAAYINGIFIAVGESGTVIQSTDGGETWEVEQSALNGTDDIYGVTGMQISGGYRAIIVGEHSKIAYADKG